MRHTEYLMPGYIKQALIESNLMEEYKQRPPYQQNDYIGWIERAKKRRDKREKS